MRLIDADFLKEWVDEYLSVFKKYDKGTIKGFVDHAPTIEPKRGEWICGTDEDGNEEWTCSICGKKHPWYPNYCPHCGADMRKETVDYKSVVLTCDDEGNWSMHGERKEGE